MNIGKLLKAVTPLVKTVAVAIVTREAGKVVAKSPTSAVVLDAVIRAVVRR